MHSETAFALETLPCGRRPSQARAVLLLKGPFFRLSTALGRLFARPLALFLLIFVAIAWGSVGALPAVASPTLVQHASKDAGVTLSSSLAFSSNNTAGNWVGVVIRAGHSGQAFAVSDTRGNAYRQAVLFNQTLDTPNGDTFGIFYAENVAGGANTVTVSESISNNTLRFAILEYSGLATTNSLDLPATLAAQGNGTSATNGGAAKHYQLKPSVGANRRFSHNHWNELWNVARLKRGDVWRRFRGTRHQLEHDKHRCNGAIWSYDGERRGHSRGSRQQWRGFYNSADA